MTLLLSFSKALEDSPKCCFSAAVTTELPVSFNDGTFKEVKKLCLETIDEAVLCLFLQLRMRKGEESILEPSSEGRILSLETSLVREGVLVMGTPESFGEAMINGEGDL